MPETRLRVETSLALHAAVADRLAMDPELVSAARVRVESWISRGGTALPLLLRWREILALPVEEVRRIMTERSENADWLRKASPFAGALPAREREHIIRAVRRRVESAA